MPRRDEPAPPPLIGGPYAAPPCEPGSMLRCRIRGRQTVGGLSDAPIPWPYSAPLQGGGGRHTLVVCGDLVRAVRTESAQAVAHHWGVGRKVVSEWRRALGVGRMTPGTTMIWQRAVAKLGRPGGGGT